MFMTTLPVPAVKDWQNDDARRSLKAYPFVGLVVGLLLLALFWLMQVVLFWRMQGAADFFQAIVLVAAWLLVTGALHFDGFCDIADAVFASKTPEERQTIAKDVSVGVFALAAGVILLLLKVAALTSLTQAFWLVLIPILARTFVLIPMRLFKVSTQSQLAQSVSGAWSDIYLPLVLGLMLMLALASWFDVIGSFIIISLVTLLFIIGLNFWISRRMDGLSGDAYGATIESSEAFMLILVSAF